jgi:hypothetical protein
MSDISSINGSILTHGINNVVISQEMNFDDLQPIEIPVKFRNRRFGLREASGDSAVKYRNAMLDATRLGPDGKPISVKGMANIEPLLVSMCLIEYIADKDGKDRERPVSEAAVRSWPNRILKPLYEKCKAISALNEDDETEEALVRRIDELQKKLVVVRKGNGTDTDDENRTSQSFVTPTPSDTTNDEDGEQAKNEVATPASR